MQLETALTSLLVGAVCFGVVSSASIPDSNKSDALNTSGESATPNICEQKDLWSLIRSWLLDDRSNCTNYDEINPDAGVKPHPPPPNMIPPPYPIGQPRIPPPDSAQPLPPKGPHPPPPTDPRDPPYILFPPPRDTFTPSGEVRPRFDEPRERGSHYDTFNRAKRDTDTDESTDGDALIPWAPSDEPKDDQTKSDADPESVDSENTTKNDLMDTADYGSLDPALDTAMINRRAVVLLDPTDRTSRFGSRYGYRRGSTFGRRRRRRVRDVEAQSMADGDSSAVDEADDSTDSSSMDASDDEEDLSSGTEYDNFDDSFHPVDSDESASESVEKLDGGDGDLSSEDSGESGVDQTNPSAETDPDQSSISKRAVIRKRDTGMDQSDISESNPADVTDASSASTEQTEDADAAPEINATSDEVNNSEVATPDSQTNTQYDAAQGSIFKRDIFYYPGDFDLDYVYRRRRRDDEDVATESTDTSDCDQAGSSASTEQTDDVAMAAATKNPMISSAESPIEPTDEVDDSEAVQKRDTYTDYWGLNLERRRRALEDGASSEIESPDSSEDSSVSSEEFGLPDSDESGAVPEGGEGADVSDENEEDSASQPAGVKKRDIALGRKKRETRTGRKKRQTLYLQPLDSMDSFGPDMDAAWTPYDDLYDSVEPSNLDYEVPETDAPEL